jgi:predicted RNA-binding protein with PIN domain
MASQIRTLHTVEKRTASTLVNREVRHLANEDIAAFLASNTSLAERELVVRHLAACNRCRKMVAEIAASQAAVKDPDERS